MTTNAEAISLPFTEAIDFFRQKVRIPTEHWTDVWRTAHSHGFMVAGAAKDALLSDFQVALRKGIEQGTTLAEFRKDFGTIVKTHGWSHTGTPGWRAGIIYDTNLSTAFSAGRYAQLTEPDTLKAFPYWTYIHSGSRHPRLQHVAWNGLTLAADDPFWSSHYPPNGWRCGCRVSPTSRPDLARMGKKKPDEAPTIETRTWINPRNGSEHEVPVGISPGFDYNPGKAWKDGPKFMPVKAPALRPGEPEPPVRLPDSAAAHVAAIKAFIEAPEGKIEIGKLHPAAAKALGEKTATVLLSDETMQKQRVKHPELTLEDYQALPELLSGPDAIIAWESQRVLLLKRGKITKAAIVKQTLDGSENYLVSFHTVRPASVRTMRRRGTVIHGSLNDME